MLFCFFEVIKMATLTRDSQTDSLFEQLMKIDGKAEIVDGEIVTIMPTGDAPGYAGDAIAASLCNFVGITKKVF